MSIDIIVDLETTGTEAGCCVLAIGACTLDASSTFYSTISHASSKEAGLIDSPDTMAWWDKQSREAREAAFAGRHSVVQAAADFSDWYKAVERRYGEAFIWGNGADFDLPILGAMYRAIGMKKPWKPFNGRCYRTFKNIPAHKAIKADEFLGVKHDALADALHEARHMRKILATLKA